MGSDSEHRLEWRGAFDNASLNALHAEAFDHEPVDYGWEDQVIRHSLGWVCAYEEGELIGFLNVAWDGGSHAYIVDTAVGARNRRRGIGRRLVATVVPKVREAGCERPHVDFEDHLRPFYFGACVFRPTSAGLVAL